MKKNCTLWHLPSLYQEFAERFSPVEPVNCELKKLDEAITIHGAFSLFRAQCTWAFESYNEFK